MGEAAVKEPSMEDILSSIRKIISEEGSQPVAEEQASVAPEVSVDDTLAEQTYDAIEQASAVTPEPVESVSYNETSGNDAAKMAASLASIAENVRAEMPAEPEVSIEPSTPEFEVPAQSVWDEVSEPSLEEIQLEETTPSLASIAETVVDQVEAPVSHVTEQISEPEIHVEMAQATPAPEPEFVPEATEEVAAPISTAAVESMVEEEMAFKGALMSPSADGAVAGAFDRLKRSAMDDVDAKTEAILRPMLREWLDENLPKMVERLVREEIERVARGV